MADIRITDGHAWLGVAGVGVQLKIYVQTPGYGASLLTQTPADSPANGTYGSGVFASAQQPICIDTTGIGMYKIWAEHPNHPGSKSNEETYYFDPDNYQGPGDPFDWNGDGLVSDLVVPAKWFTILGIHKRILPQVQQADLTDWDHIVVSTTSVCDVTTSNLQHYVTVYEGQSQGQASFSGLKYAFPGTPGNDFYAYVRDHLCPDAGAQSEPYKICDVTASGGNYSVGTLTLDFS